MTEAERLACVHPQDRERAAHAGRHARDDGLPLEFEFRIIWPDGQVRAQAPQLPLSVPRSRQVPLQLVVPSPHDTAQVPAEHT